MTALSTPRHPLVNQALADARVWCAGRIIDDRPALVHAVRVAATLDQHVSGAAPDLIAAALLHDAPEFAPPGTELDAVLNARYGPEVPRIVNALHVEHVALDQPDPPILVHDQVVLLASTADKIVALTSLLRRARASGDVNSFFTRRVALLRLLPHFRAFQHAGSGRVPAGMSTHLDAVLNTLDRAPPARPPGSPSDEPRPHRPALPRPHDRRRARPADPS